MGILNVTSDDNTAFGEYVAAERRQLLSDIRRKLKSMIQNAIVEMNEDDNEFSYTLSSSTQLSSLAS